MRNGEEDWVPHGHCPVSKFLNYLSVLNGMWLVLRICSRISNSWPNNSLADKRWSSGSPQANVVLGEKSLQIMCSNNSVYSVSCSKGGSAQTKELEEIWESKLGAGGLYVLSIIISVLKLFPYIAFEEWNPQICVLKTWFKYCLTLRWPAVLRTFHPVFSHLVKFCWSLWVCHPDVILDNLRLKI